MNVIVVGGGTVGSTVARVLSSEKHDVTLIDPDPDRREAIQSRLDILTLGGNGASPKVLERAGARDSDLLIAATHSDEVNMIACANAKAFGVKQTIARIHHPDYLETAALTPQARGIDHVINPDEAAVEEIERLLEHTWALDIAEFADGAVEMMGMRLTADDAIVGKTLSEIGRLSAHQTIILAAVVRHGELIIPQGKTVLKEDDMIYVIGKQGAMTAISFLCGHPDEACEQVTIFGGSRPGLMLASILEGKGIKTKLIELNRERAVECAARLRDTLVIHGDATDVQLLRQENIADSDGYVAISDNSETNLLTSALVRRLGVSKTIAVLKREDYAALAFEMGITTTVSVTSATADAILRFVRKGMMHNVTTISGGDAEIYELDVPPQCRISGKPLFELTIPDGILIGAVIRRSGEVEIAHGKTVIEAGNRVVVIARLDAISDLERLFGPTRKQRGMFGV